LLRVASFGRDALGAPDLLLLGGIGIASLVGDFYVKYCIVKAGVYVPLVGAAGVPGSAGRRSP